MGPDGEQQLTLSDGFVGRHTEVSRVLAVLESATSGNGAAVLLSGEPGIGKTRLAEEMAWLASAGGWNVSWGRWREGVVYPEFWVWRRLLQRFFGQLDPALRLEPAFDSLLAEVSVLVPAIREHRPDLPPALSDTGMHARLRLFEGVYALLRAAASGRPQLLVLDNLHLAGEASLQLAFGLLEELRDMPLALLGTYRDLPIYRRPPFREFLADARHDAAVTEITLRGLSLDDAAALVRWLAGQEAAPEVAREIHRRSGGNPLFVQELAQPLCAQAVRCGPAHGPPERQAAETGPMPQRLDELISRRLSALSGPALELLRQACVIGESFSSDDLALLRAVGKQNAFEAPLAEAVSRGFLVSGDRSSEYHFSHALVHEAVRAHLPPDQRVVVASALVQAVEATHGDQLTLWARRLADWSALVPGRQAAAKRRRYLGLAAEQALASSAWEETFELARLAAKPVERQPRTRGQADAHLLMGRARFMSGDRSGAIPFFRRAFEWYKQHGELEPMIQIATQPGYLNAGEPGFYNYFEELLPLLPEGSPLLGSVLHFYGIILFQNAGEYQKAEDLLHRALGIGRAAGDPSLEARCLCALAYLDNRFVRHEQAIDKCEQALAVLGRCPDVFARIHAAYVRYEASVALGRAAQAFPATQGLIDLVRAYGDGNFLAKYHFVMSRYHFRRGDLGAARRLVGQGLACLPDAADLCAFGCLVEYGTGDFQSGDRLRGRILAQQRRTPSGPYYVHLHAVSTALARAYCENNPGDLRRHVPLLRSIAGHPAAVPFIRLRAQLLLAFLAWQARDGTLAAEAYEALTSRPPLYLVRPYLISRYMGLAAARMGEHERAVAHLRQSLEEVRHFGDRPLEAWILCELGEVLRATAQDQVGAALQPLREALAMAQELGLAPLAERCRRDLAEADAAPPAGGHGSRLSGRELQVLRLISEGGSNAVIASTLGVSLRTVANHVHAILQKTGAKSRTEAAAFARRAGYLR